MVMGAKLDEIARDLLRREGWDLAAMPALVCAQDGTLLAMNSAAVSLQRAGADVAAAAADATTVAGESPQHANVKLTAHEALLHLELLAMPRPDLGMVVVTVQDRTLETNLREALIESRHRFRDLLDLSGAFGWEIDADGICTFVSQKGALGYPAERFLGAAFARHTADGADDLATLPLTSPVPVEDVEVLLCRADGGTAPHLVSSIPLYDRNGQRSGARGICRDITMEREQERSLARALQRERLVTRVLEGFRSEVAPSKALALAAEALRHGMAATGCQIISATPSLTAPEPKIEILARHGDTGGSAEMQLACDRILADEVVTADVRDWLVLIVPAWFRDAANGALLLWRLDDEAPWDEDDRRLANLFATHVGFAIEQVQQHRRLVTVAQTDPLTGVLNRRGFQEEVRRRMLRTQRTGEMAALMYVDLDNFKAVNDRHGHTTGDEALLFVRDLLRTNIRPNDLIGRLGGDEFALWLDGAGRDVAEKRAQLLVAGSRALRRFSGSTQQPLGLSIGIVLHEPTQPETLEELVARADRVMYEVKRSGRSGFAVAQPAIAVSP